MGMDLRNPNVWISCLLESLSEDKQASALNDDNPDWEYIDGEIVKLGSLAHGQLDIPEIQRRGLGLLAAETKDFRLFAHLLRTLQQAGELLPAARLLALYVEHYWAVAAPVNRDHKKRLALQVIKRFDAGIAGFVQSAALPARDALLGELAKLALCWQANGALEMAQAIDDLSAQCQREFRETAPAQSVTGASNAPQSQAVLASHSPLGPAENNVSTSVPQITIDSHDDTAWRDTLLKVAAVLCDRQPGSPQGWRLRRHALWQSVTSAPQAENDGRTPLAGVSADMVADYQARLASADMALWQQVEQSLLLAPYWLDGHYLSAQIALKLGHSEVAEAIRNEVVSFVDRLPSLTTLLFNDRTPFMNERTRRWLEPVSVSQGIAQVQTSEEMQVVRTCFAEQGLEAALRLIDALPQGDPRDQFYRQYLAAQLMEEAGLLQLAQQHYRMLFKTGLKMMVADWEPSLLEQLEQKFTEEQ